MRRIGVDIDQTAITRGIETHGKSGIEFIFGDFNRFEMSWIPDVITMFHVLEHLPDPVATLRNLRAVSRAGTHLVVEVPILENGMTNDVNGFFSALHMTHFSRQSLANSLNRAGWVIEERFEQADYNGCRVLAVAGPATDGVFGAQEDEVSLARYLAHWKSAVAAVSARLDEAMLTGRVVIWGGGLHTEFLYHLTELFRVPEREFVIVDSDPMKQGRSWRGISIIPPSRLPEIDWATAKLVVSSYGGQDEIAGRAISHGAPPARTVLLYDHVSIH